MDAYIGPVVQVIVGALAASGVVWGARLAGRWNAHTKTIEATTPTYADMAESLKALDERLKVAEKALDEEREKRRALEDRIHHIEDDRRHDRMWIERTIRRVIDHDPSLTPLLLPWPGWYTPTTPPTLD